MLNYPEFRTRYQICPDLTPRCVAVQAVEQSFWGMGKMRTCGLADLQTGKRVNCGPSLRTGSAYYPRVLSVATARLPMHG